LSAVLRGPRQHGPLGVRKTEELVRIARRIAALELTVATRSVDQRGGPQLGAGTAKACAIAREFAASEPKERWPDVDELTQTVAGGRFVAGVAVETGPLEPVSTTGDAVGPGEPTGP
jgi:histidine ammonia-lyase